jgi:CheY-like chemotaxis protein
MEAFVHPWSVLIVDDEEDFLETIVRRLERRNIDVTGVRSGEEALRKLRERDFQVILLDVKMPGGMDGIETLREIKKMSPQAQVILLTGHGAVPLNGCLYVLGPAGLIHYLRKRLLVRAAYHRWIPPSACFPYGRL